MRGLDCAVPGMLGENGEPSWKSLSHSAAAVTIALHPLDIVKKYERVLRPDCRLIDDGPNLESSHRQRSGASNLRLVVGIAWAQQSSEPCEGM